MWLLRLLRNPTHLFGTTLIGVNLALQFGSECSRRFYLSLGISPDFAPLTQIIIVLLFAELSPMFAARRYAEHVVRLGIAPLYFFAQLMRPLIWILGLLCKGINFLFRVQSSTNLYLTREELQKAIEAHKESTQRTVDFVSENIFKLKSKPAREVMIPLNKLHLLPSKVNIGQVSASFKETFHYFIPLYHLSKHNIVAIAYPRDLLRLSKDIPVRLHAHSPWFITEHTPILDIVTQFRSNHQSLAVVLDDAGLAVGIVTLKMLLEAILGEREKTFYRPKSKTKHIDRSFPASQLTKEVVALWGLDLPAVSGNTLEDVMHTQLGHPPDRGEHVYIGDYEFILEPTSLLENKVITIKSCIN